MQISKFLPTVVTLAALSATSAQAAATRVFVSGKGSDSGACASSAAPCRTLAFALNAVTAGGEVVVLDSGDYGPVKIVKAVGVVNDSGGVAAVTRTTAGAAIEVAAGLADKVVLRGLTVEGAGVATYGVLVTSAGSVDLTDMSLRNFVNDGVHVNAVAGPLAVTMSKVDASDNRASGMFLTGLYSITARISETSFNRNGINGFYALNYQAANVAGLLTQIAIAGGEAHGNAYGYRVESTVATSPVFLLLDDVTASRNATAGVSSAGSVIEARLSKSVIAYNAVGATGVKLTSLKNNVFSGNTTDVGGALGAAAPF